MIRRHRNLLLSGIVAIAALTLALPALARQDATTNVTVNAGLPSEFAYKLSKTAAKRGTVVFKLVNKGDIKHNFKIGGKKTPAIASGKSATLSLTTTKVGSYPYLCTLPGHAAAGMKGTFKVT